jgi:hypothetical protein
MKKWSMWAVIAIILFEGGFGHRGMIHDFLFASL